MRLSILFLSLFSFVLISCGGNKKANNNNNNNNNNNASANASTVEQSDFDQQITGKYWKLILLEGQAIEMVENQEREIFFTLNAQNNTLGGFAGCNSITGEYKLEKDNRIRFKNMGITMIICPDVPVDESEFMEVFELTDNYTIHKDTLSLNVGRRAPLAMFEAVYL